GGIQLKLLTLKDRRLGVRVDEGIIDVEVALKKFPDENISPDMMDVIHGGEEAVKNLEDYIVGLDLQEAEFLLNEDDIEWGPAVTNPKQIICVGLNYRKHADET